MKLRSLSHHANLSCNLITVGHTTFLVDCALNDGFPQPVNEDSSEPNVAQPKKRKRVEGELNTGEKVTSSSGERGEGSDGIQEQRRSYLFQSPQLGDVDWKSVDFILISNSKSGLALPYITEYTEFAGKVYATEPTAEFSSLLMKELVHYFGSKKAGSKASTDADAGVALLYTMADVEAAVNKIIRVRYMEHLALSDRIRVAAYSSGYSLGSANWRVENEELKLVLLSKSSNNGSFHPTHFDEAIFDNVDAIIVDDVKVGEVVGYDASLNQLGAIVAQTISNQGNVILPVAATGLLYDIIDHLSMHLSAVGLGEVPYYVFSPVAEESLHHANILGEWMNSTFQNKMYLPEAPLAHGQLMWREQLFYGPELDSTFSDRLREPCIVFCGHTSILEGPIKQLLSMWKSSDKHSLVFTESSSEAKRELSHYQPLKMNVYECAFDGRLSLSETLAVISRHNIGSIFVPEEYRNTDMERAGTSEKVTFYRRGTTLDVPSVKKSVQSAVTEQFARTIEISSISNLSLARVSGVMYRRDNKCEILEATDAEAEKLRTTRKRCLLGPVLLPELIKCLVRRHIVVESAEQVGSEVRLKLLYTGQKATLVIRNGTSTKVKSSSAEFGLLLSDALAEIFQRL